MIKNYITENLEFLIHQSKVSQDDFGNLFDLKRGVVGQYLRSRNLPKIETLQRIAQHYKITLDDLVNRPLTDKGSKVEDPGDEYTVGPKYIELLQKSLEDKEKIIQGLEFQLDQLRRPGKKGA